MRANERRMKVIEVLCHRRKDTVPNLAIEFGVSERTMHSDIEILSLTYPLETIRGRYGGGVKVADGYYLNRKYLKPEQQKLLEKLSTSLSGNDLEVMNSIIKDFALNN